MQTCQRDHRMSSQSSTPADFRYCLAPMDPLVGGGGRSITQGKRAKGYGWSVDGKGTSSLELEKIGQRGMVAFSSMLRSLNIVGFQIHNSSPLKGSRTSQGIAQ